jgi:hypothetical protein
MIERPRGRDGAGSCRRDFDSHDVADAWFRQSLEMLEAIQSHPEVGQTLLAYGRLLARTSRRAGPDWPGAQPLRGNGRDRMDRGGAPRSQRDAGPEQIAKL